MEFGVVSVVGITMICYCLAECVKVTKIDNKYLPAICGIIGLIMGLVAFYLGMPDFPAQDPINAAAVGIASGFAATGINQIYKQYKNGKEE